MIERPGQAWVRRIGAHLFRAKEETTEMSISGSTPVVIVPAATAKPPA
jgi:hypothetical protein